MTESSDDFSIFESLKKKPADATISSDPFEIPSHHEPPRKKDQRALVTRDKLASEEAKGSPAKDTAPRPRTAARKSLANSKVKLAALEMEEETEVRKPKIQEQLEYDYSLPASNSSSPAASPTKKRAAAKKKPATKKPAPKPKKIAREAKAATGSRATKPKPAPSPPVHQDSGAQLDEEQNGDTLPAEERSIVTQPSRGPNPLPQKNHRNVERAKSPNVDQMQDVVMVSSDSTTSFPESDNTDDEDFECSRKITPGNARRRTRAVAAESAAAKEAKRKSESQPAALANVRRYEVEDEVVNPDSAERPKKQSKKPHKKTAVEKAQASAKGTEPKSESTKKINSSTEKSVKEGSTSKRTGAANRSSRGTIETKQETVVSSKGDCVGRGEANKLHQSSGSAKQVKQSDRKPNVVAFGPGGPKNNGRSHKTTAATDSRSCHQQPSPKNAEHDAVTTSQQSKGLQKAPKIQLDTVRDRDSPVNDFAGHVEGDSSRAARANQLAVAGAAPDNSPISKADNEPSVSHFDAEMTTLNYDGEGGDASDQFVAGDAEADTAVEVAANSMADSPDHRNQDVTNVFEKGGSGKFFSPLTQADVEHHCRREQRTVLGEVDANCQTIPKDVPAVMPRLMKRKLPDTRTVEERSPVPQALLLKTGSQSGSFSALRTNSTALASPSKGGGRPVKKPRYNSAYAARDNEDTSYGSHLGGGPDSLSRGVGSNTVDDVFGPGKKDEPSGPSAFVQRLISNESADRGPGQTGWVAPASSDARAAPRQHPIVISHPPTVRSVAPGVALRPQGSQQLDDVGKRMLAALVPEKAQVPGPWSPGDDLSTTFLAGDPTESSPSDAFDRRRVSGADERTRAWKKATEPYADSLGETMHKIVNVSRTLRHHDLLVPLLLTWTDHSARIKGKRGSGWRCHR